MAYHGHGYGAPADYPPPGYTHPGGFTRGAPLTPAVDPAIQGWFNAVDTDRSGAITVVELQKALINGDWTPFDLDTVKLLMNLFDVDHSGAIGVNEFAGLWKYIQDWQRVFRHHDRDQSGSIGLDEFAAALRDFDLNLPPGLLNIVQWKYASTTAGGRRPALTFDRFLRASVVIRQLIEAFQRLDTDRDGWIQISYEEFMKLVLSLP
ncbi:EF-hand [Leucogyrophana mollusca]|uniref:EF-hand n=1 Tax=Leucogyrophana mollusca TaxID=85980 RepID=A0ACB8B5D5_9AGAM|nr:EF-hand [Leucogyrophana mollusca]